MAFGDGLAGLVGRATFKTPQTGSILDQRKIDRRNNNDGHGFSAGVLLASSATSPNQVNSAHRLAMAH